MIQILDFGAPWCGPCRQLKPIMEEISLENLDKFDVKFIDVENEPELAAQHKIRGVPALVVIKDNKVVETIVGFMSKEKLLAKFNSHV